MRLLPLVYLFFHLLTREVFSWLNWTDGTAELRVLVTTALGALPLENAIVSVSTVPDESGMRTLLHLGHHRQRRHDTCYGARHAAAQQFAEPDGGPPFAVYTVEISAEGYTPLTAPAHRAMFSGVPTMLPVAPTPLKENQSLRRPT